MFFINVNEFECCKTFGFTKGALILNFFDSTRSYAALRAADLDWIVGLGYNWGGYILGVFSTSRFVPPALSSDWRRVATHLGAGISKNVTNVGSQLTSGQE